MNKSQIEAYNYYKQLYPMAILLFRIGDEYVALMEDSEKVATSLSLTQINNDVPQVAFPAQCLEYLSRLGNDGYEIRAIAVRNDQNVFDYPDVTRLEEEKSSDY